MECAPRQRRDRGRDDERAGALLDHVRAEGLQREQHAGRVDREHALPGGVVELEHRHVAADAGIGAGDVDPAVRVQHGRERSLVPAREVTSCRTARASWPSPRSSAHSSSARPARHRRRRRARPARRACARSRRRSPRRRRRRTQPSRPAASPCQTTGVTARTAYEKIWDDHALGNDLLLRRSAPRPRGHEPAGVRGTAARRAHGAATRSHDRDGRPQRADVGALAPDRGRDRPAAARRAGAQRRGVRHPVLRPRAPPPGHRPRDRARARHHAAGHDDRLRRLAHLHARRLRRARVRHRHERGRARAGHADAAAEARAHAARDVHRRARASASAPRT